MRIAPRRNYYELHTLEGNPNKVFTSLRSHELMLSDVERLRRYRNAIQQFVTPKSVVLDLGTGTGILALFAAQAGAKRIYAVEQFRRILDLARQVGDASPWRERLVWIEGHSTRVELPEKVDLIVTETIGHVGIEEGIVPSLADAARRFLKGGGVVMPSRLRLFLAPVESRRLYESVTFWKKPLLGIDLSPIATAAARWALLSRISETMLLCAPVEVAELQLTRLGESILKLAATFRSRRSGTLHGFAAWFGADLARGVEITNAPNTNCRSWHQWFFPAERAVHVRRGRLLTANISVSTASSDNWNWQVNVQ